MNRENVKSLLPITCLLLSALVIANQQKNGRWYDGDGNSRFKWSFGCSFPKQVVSISAADIHKKKMNQSSTCPRLCYDNHHCTHFIYTNGYCYLKAFKWVDASPKAAVFDNPGGLCGSVVDRPDVVKNWSVGNSGRTRWSTYCEYPNVIFNVYSETKIMFDRSKCADHCLSIKRCSHFAWAASICWIKDIRGAPIVQTLDKLIPLCGFIPERHKAAITKRPSRTNVSTKGTIGSNLTTSLSTNSSFISNQKKQNVSSLAQPKTYITSTKKTQPGARKA